MALVNSWRCAAPHPMDDSILLLQALLAATFEQKSAVRLSERNVVELVRTRCRVLRACVVTSCCCLR